MRKCEICNITNNETEITTKRCKFKKELCRYHYDRLRFSNGEYRRNIRDENEIRVFEKHCEMNLYDKKGIKIETTIFDRRFLKEVKKHKWSTNYKGKTCYVKTVIKLKYKNQYNKKALKLHQLVMPCEYPYEIDHKDRNGLNNLISNLRIVSRRGNAENQRSNTSGYAGVTLRKATGRWESRITVNKNRIYLGVFDTREEAAEARNRYKLNNNIK